MNKNQFRLVLLSTIVFAIMTVVVAIWFPAQHVDIVYDYIFELEAETTQQYFSDIWVMIIAGLVLLIVVLSYVGLFLFKSWARHLYVAGFVLALPFYFFNGLDVSGGIQNVFYDLSMLASGAVFALIYYSPVKDYFARSHT